jgi:hypothetical protein
VRLTSVPYRCVSAWCQFGMTGKRPRLPRVTQLPKAQPAPKVLPPSVVPPTTYGPCHGQQGSGDASTLRPCTFPTIGLTPDGKPECMGHRRYRLERETE